ncbi:MAG: 50S ribosomal protein L23 [Thermodesulfobacteriota bacterium]|nr:50S ribosomal protein L23 [Thermodesulfobacteriota bacterium]
MQNIYNIIKRPYITEKSNIQKEENNKISFKVYKDANKIEIKKSIERLFKVKILKVNIVKVKGKVKRVGRNEGKRPDWKKAIVTLREGDQVDFFEGI